LRRYWERGAAWTPEFVSSNALLDIARREVDFGFRNVRPDQNWLAARQTREIDYAEYATSAEVHGFVTLSENLATTRSTRWVYENYRDAIVTTVSEPSLAMEAAKQGVARVVLPRFVGDAETGLNRVSEPIAALTHGEWLVTHHDARHDPPIRRALDAITEFVTNSGK
jgi:DNA-binding transcriptional LysR family regulator